MKITKRQLRRIIREESKGSTKKYDDDSALRGDQDELPDALQKGIIDKTVGDREEKEKNESYRITKQQLRRIIREERIKLDEANPEYPSHMFPERNPKSGGWPGDPRSDDAATRKKAAEDLNGILNKWNQNPHLDADAMRALPKHVRASLDDLFIEIEDVMLGLKIKP